MFPRLMVTIIAAVFAIVAALSTQAAAQNAAPMSHAAQLAEAERLNADVIGLYQAGKAAEAIVLAERALALRRAALPEGHPDIANSLNNLALLYQLQGRYVEAEPLYREALALRQAALPEGHPDIAGSLNNLALFYLTQRDWLRAADLLRQSTALLVGRVRREAEAPGGAAGKKEAETQRFSGQFSGLVKVAQRLAAECRGDHDTLAREMFMTAQWGRGSEAAAALTQAAVRGSAGDAELARLVRERQDLVGEWDGLDKQLIAARIDRQRNSAWVSALTAQIEAVEARVRAIDATLRARFPNYAALSAPEPSTIAEVQAQLRDDEALALFLDTDARYKPLPEETFVWVMTKSSVRWARFSLGTAALQREFMRFAALMPRLGMLPPTAIPTALRQRRRNRCSGLEQKPAAPC